MSSKAQDVARALVRGRRRIAPSRRIWRIAPTTDHPTCLHTREARGLGVSVWSRQNSQGAEVRTE